MIRSVVLWLYFAMYNDNSAVQSVSLLPKVLQALVV